MMNLPLLADDCLLEICKHLPVICIGRLACVSQRFKVLIDNTDIIWYRLVKNVYGVNHSAQWAERTRDVYGVGNYKTLLKLLRTIGDIEGTWRLANKQFRPAGRLVLGSVSPGRASLKCLSPCSSDPFEMEFDRLGLIDIYFDTETGAITSLLNGENDVLQERRMQQKNLVRSIASAMFPANSAKAWTARTATVLFKGNPNESEVQSVGRIYAPCRTEAEDQPHDDDQRFFVAIASDAYGNSDRSNIGVDAEYLMFDFDDDMYGLSVFERIIYPQPNEAHMECIPASIRPLFSRLWFSEYGGHGLEIISLHFIDNCSRAETEGDLSNTFRGFRSLGVDFGGTNVICALKVTGDPNVPSGRSTFVTHMTDQLVTQPNGRMFIGTEKECSSYTLPSNLPIQHIQLNMNAPRGHWNPWWGPISIGISEDCQYIEANDFAYGIAMHYYGHDLKYPFNYVDD